MLKYRMAEAALLKKSFVHLGLIALLGLAAYSNTFNVPFQWDENTFIGENPAVKTPCYFLEPSKAEGRYYGIIKNRYVGYLSFALNYKLHGLDVTGYHIVNLLIHILNSFLVYFLVLLTFRTPFLSNPPLAKGGEGGFNNNLIAFFSALLFVSHPVQTEAVTYIFQRLASLAAFFYMLSLLLYIKSRLTEKKTNYAFYALSLLSAVLAMKTKENAFTLPIVITLYEFFFFKGHAGRRILRLVPLLLTMLIIPLTFAGSGGPEGEIRAADFMGKDGAGIWRVYLFTQFRVIVTYIRLLFFPVNQNLYYDFPLSRSFLGPAVFLSFIFLLSILGFAVYLFYRSKTKRPDLRLISFGVFWFFITLSVESGAVPLPSVIDEYRVYLPSAGVFAALSLSALVLAGRMKNMKLHGVILLIFFLAPLVFTYATYKRNDVWASRISLWTDAAKKSPHKEMAHYNLGKAYQDEGMTEKAIENYLAALRLKPDYAEAHINLGAAYGSMGMTEKAIERYRAALNLKPDSVEAHFNLGVIYLQKGLTNEARQEFEAVLKINPGHQKARRFLDYMSGAG